MKILLLVDKLNWAYHSIAKSLCKYNTEKDISFDVLPIKGGIDRIKKEYHKYDLFYIMGFQTDKKLGFLPKDKTVIGIHSCHSWDNKQTTPTNIVYPDSSLIDHLNSYLRVNAVSKYLYDIFKKSGLNNLYYTPNGVDSKVFVPFYNGKEEFTIGYSGTKTHDWRKGISEFILPSAKKAGVKVNLAMRIKGETIPLEEMPSFYNTLDAYICASSSEGFSLSVLEAASCGVPIISTRITGCTELVLDCENGLFVDRNVDDIVKKINMLKNNQYARWMGSNMRMHVERYHCWSKKIDKWINFFKGE
jgi:glycosyltransferase involved in cell wall biosynthesis